MEGPIVLTLFSPALFFSLHLIIIFHFDIYIDDDDKREIHRDVEEEEKGNTRGKILYGTYILF